MKRLLGLVALFGIAGSALASLGDDEERIEDLYGPLVQRHLLDDGQVSAVFHKGNDKYLYYVTFDKGVSVLEKMVRADGAELSEKEIARLLKTNTAHGTKWSADSKSKERRFERSDHRVEAIYEKVNGRGTLTVRAVGMGKKAKS